MTRLLLVEALRRYGAGLALVLLAGGWLWRSLPPWVLRDGWWALSVPAQLASLFAGVLVYLGLTAPVVRLLLRSDRLEYWRQFAIAPAQWRTLQRGQLLIVHTPAAITVAYLLAPGGPALCIAGLGLSLVVMLGSGRAVAQLGDRPHRSRRRHVPPRGRVITLARLSMLALRRQQSMHLRAVVAGQLGLLGFAALGVSHVAAVEPQAGPPLLRTLAIVAAITASSAVVVAVRALDRDRWFLDTFTISPGPELSARVLLGVFVGLPTLFGSGLAALPLGLHWGLAGLALGITAALWGAAFGARIAAAAEARRDLHRPRPAVFVLRFVYGLALVHTVGPLALGTAALVEAALARRALVRAATTRARFETTTVEDDHG